MPRLFPKPTVPGFYWAKMICGPSPSAEKWEVFEVDENFGVWGICDDLSFTCDDFEWGPRVMPPFDGPTGTVADISDDDLLRRAVRSARSTRYSVGAPHPRWVAVKDALALGRTYSAQLCERFGFDPDEKVKR